jgi:hypothetical protein
MEITKEIYMITAGGTKVYTVYTIYKYIWGDTVNFFNLLPIPEAVQIATDLEIFNS